MKPNFKFYDKDPQKGGKEISFWDYMEQSGMNKMFKSFAQNIPHNFELLKPARQGVFEKAKQRFIKERKLIRLETTEIELKFFYKDLLDKELEVIGSWLKENKTSISDRIEILKYEAFIKAERDKSLQTAGDNSLTLETEDLKIWILPQHLSIFTEIEKQLFSMEIIDKDYKWKLKKKKLIDFITIIVGYGFFRPKIKGKGLQRFHYRRFISQRYGLGEYGLKDIVKKYKPTPQEALISFSWIQKPE